MGRKIRFIRIASRCAVCVAILVLGSAARADDQADRIQALERRLQTSLELIERLTSRVNELERAAKVAPVTAKTEVTATRAEPTREVARSHEGADHMSASPGRLERESVTPIHGFADVGGLWSTAGDPDRRRGFNVGTLDLYLTPQFGDRVKGLVEIAFEFDDSGVGTSDMERLQLGYTVNDALTLWMGRFHTPFGLWNTMFHHGATLQTSIFRPRFVGFEDQGGVLPVHAVGLWATGRLRLGSDAVTYDAYVGNGPTIRERRLDPNSFAEGDSNKLIGFNLGYQPGGKLAGLTLGIHGFGSRINAVTPSGTTLNSTRVRSTGGYFAYEADDWESIGEYYHFGNSNVSGGARYSSNAWFLHVGRSFGSLTPFVRFERASLDPDDNYFRAQRSGRSYKRAAVGARYDLDSMSAVKFELNSTREPAMLQVDEAGALVPFAGGSYRRAAVQYSISF